MVKSKAALSGPRILVVDDNEDNRYTLTLYLDLEGHRNIVTANDGEEAIVRLKSEPFDLVLLDVMMPKVDGYEVLFWLKDQPRLRDLPVIMISALNEINSVIRCIELGAVDYLFKPFNPTLLMARLGATLEKKQLRDQVNAHLNRLENELEAARKLQLGMVPHVFPSPTAQWPIDLFAMMEPAREVGGDLYDFFTLPDGRLCFLVGDVSGKGMPAALFMARTKSLVRMAAELMRSGDGGVARASDIIGRVNRELAVNNAAMMFVTMFFAILDLATGQLEFCNAGHNPPYRLKGGEVVPIEEPRGIVLGVLFGAAHQTGQLLLAPGETIYLFTDGVTEANDAGTALFSEARLEAALRRSAGRTSADLIEGVTAELRTFVGAAKAFDDITMLALRRLRGTGS